MTSPGIEPQSPGPLVIDNAQENCKRRLCGDKDHITSDFSKLAQKECKMRYDWVGKVFH